MAGQHRESIRDLIADFDLQSEIVTSPFEEEHSSIGSLIKWLPLAFRNCYDYVRTTGRAEGARPLVVVHGDTLSTLVGAVAGRLAGGEIVHLESGLSSGRLLDPFPEEILRRLTFRFARYALCPNSQASARMRRLGAGKVVDTGDNTLLDCVRFAVQRNENMGRKAGREYFVASIHRFSNIYRRSDLSRILDEILEVSGLGTVHFVLHPPTERQLRQSGLFDTLCSAPGIELQPRMPFTQFLALLAGARAVFSDGGSNQEELSYLGVPTILFRERSERPDGLGINIVLRKQVDGSLSQFVSSGKVDELRQPSRVDVGAHPSEEAVQALLSWAGGTLA
jgi:UDP-N-acetylglucosamine 2-epimerase (non-hydrolysing)